LSKKTEAENRALKHIKDLEEHNRKRAKFYKGKYGESMKGINRHKTSLNEIPERVQCPLCDHVPLKLEEKNGYPGYFCPLCQAWMSVGAVRESMPQAVGRTLNCPGCDKPLIKLAGHTQKGLWKIRHFKCRTIGCHFAGKDITSAMLMELFERVNLALQQRKAAIEMKPENVN